MPGGSDEDNPKETREEGSKSEIEEESDNGDLEFNTLPAKYFEFGRRTVEINF